jgi:molecular chaperone HscB
MRMRQQLLGVTEAISLQPSAFSQKPLTPQQTMTIHSQLDPALQATEAAGSLCWACGSAVEADAHFCPACGKVQRAAESDHFRFFGLQRKLVIDVPSLEREFYKLSRKLHPDLFVRATADEQAWSLQKSSQLNDAYRTLKEPIARTQYLLGLEGVKLEEQSSAATKAARESGTEKKQVVPPELLEEVFELNMQLQELRMNKQMGEADEENTQALQAAKSRFEEQLAGIGKELEVSFAEWDSALDSNNDSLKSGAKENLVAILNKRSYIRNLVRDVNEVLES